MALVSRPSAYMGSVPHHGQGSKLGGGVREFGLGGRRQQLGAGFGVDPVSVTPVPGLTDHAGAGGPENTNGPVTAHWHLSTLDTLYKKGDWSEDQLLYICKPKDGAKIHVVEMQAYQGLSLGMLNHCAMFNPSFQKCVSVNDDPWRLMGVVITKNETLFAEHKLAVSVAVTIGGRHAMIPNIWLLTATRPIIEGMKLYIIEVPYSPAEDSVTDVRAWVAQAVANPKKRPLAAVVPSPVKPAARKKRALPGAPLSLAAAESDEEKEEDEDEDDGAGGAADAPFASMEDLWSAVGAKARATGAVAPASGDDLKRFAPSVAKGKPHAWLRIPYASLDGAPPPPSLRERGKVKFVGTVVHRSRGPNIPTAEQVKFAQEAVFPRARNEDYFNALSELDRIEISLIKGAPCEI
mgnify:CR=1 FL=1